MATAHLIYGYIGAGKTTYAQSLAERLGGVRFSTDEWVATLYDEDESRIPDMAPLIRRVETVMEPLWCRCLSLGVDVVLDLGFWARSKRDTARRLAERCGASSRLHHVRCRDREVAWARVERRNHDPRGSIRMSRHTFDVLEAKVEPPGEDEDHVLIET
ncbi:ATP-binding protein [Actinopolymorpha sp. B17G11]|uniref:AAA family ATPase n=1 Tax=unclassified Actinopolymorpha TaxID=2627063 RepID=UPI0032D90E0D